jgi:ubiquitin-conjugating enzyme E2 G1
VTVVTKFFVFVSLPTRRNYYLLEEIGTVSVMFGSSLISVFCECIVLNVGLYKVLFKVKTTMTGLAPDQGTLLLKKQLAELQKNPVDGFSAGLVDDNDIYKWEVMIIGPPDTFFEGGFFKAHLIFPKEYPQRPPKMKFVSEMWHPNVDKDGNVCISILHEPGEDKWGYEKAEERWLPVHTVETILVSVISMLSDPNDESPANVDAAKDWREDYNGDFKKKVMRCVRKSQDFV